MADPIPGVTPADASVRSVVRFESADARAAARTTSDILLYASLARPLAQDVIEHGFIGHDWRGAAGASVIDGLAQATSAGVNFGAKYAFSAAGLGNRPLIAECAKDPSYDPYCGTGEMTLGMPSGHSQAAWNGFGIAVAHRLWDSRHPTPTLELVGLGATAATVSYLRMAADKHTLTQVGAGAALGVGIGIGVPALAQAVGLGYDHWGDKPAPFVPTLSVGPDGGQIGIAGHF